MKTKINIYTPAQKEVKDYGLGKVTEVTINGQSVIPILADKIYKSPYSAIRELYVNEVTAVKKALRINSNLKPEIHISLDTNTRELRIKGVDSLGIDTATFKHILAVMGNSGNNKGDETGYYGLGFYSFVKISERIIINSYSLESGEKWACIAKSALKFEQLPKGTFKPLDKTGFEITLTVKNELEIDSITRRIREISQLSGVKTFYTVDKVPINLDQYDNLEAYFKHEYSDYFEGKANYSIMYQHIDNDDFELIIGKTSNRSTMRGSYLINVPIELDFHHSMPNIVLINVKNERTFKPSADRERFNETDETELMNQISTYDFETHEKLPEIDTIQEWYDSRYRYFYQYIGSNFSMSNYVVDGKEKETYYNKLKRIYIKDALPSKKPKEFRISKTLRKKAFEKYEKENIFAIKVSNDRYYKEFIKVGFVDIDEGKNVKTRSSSSNNLVKRFKFHNYFTSYDELPHDALAVIRVDDVRTTDLKRYIRMKDVYFITRRADYEGDISLEEFKNMLDDTTVYPTNKGYLTARQIIKLSERYTPRTLSNNNYKTEDLKNVERYMSHLYNFKEHKLIIKIGESQQCNILESVLSLNHGYMYGEHIDFYSIKANEEKEQRDAWKNTITDTRLSYLIEQTNFINVEEMRCISSIQEQLNKK